MGDSKSLRKRIDPNAGDDDRPSHSGVSDGSSDEKKSKDGTVKQKKKTNRYYTGQQARNTMTPALGKR